MHFNGALFLLAMLSKTIFFQYFYAAMMSKTVLNQSNQVYYSQLIQFASRPSRFHLKPLFY